MSHYIYILANKPNGEIHVGSARDLRQRLEQHHAGMPGSHTHKYNIRTLVYFERHDRVNDAVARERSLKKWRRDWKDELIASVNPEWRDLSSEIPN